MAGLHALIESRENIRCVYLDDHLAFCASFSLASRRLDLCFVSTEWQFSATKAD